MTTNDNSDSTDSNDSNDSNDKHDGDREMPRHIATWTGGVADRAGLAALMELMRAYRRAQDAARAATAMLADAGIGPDEITAVPILSYEGRPRVVLRTAPGISENAVAWLRRHDPYFSTEPSGPAERLSTTTKGASAAIARSNHPTRERGQSRDRNRGGGCNRTNPDTGPDTGHSAPPKAWWAA